MPAIFMYLRARCIRSGLAACLILSSLSACQSVPLPPPRTAECECPTFEEMCPAPDTLEVDYPLDKDGYPMDTARAKSGDAPHTSPLAFAHPALETLPPLSNTSTPETPTPPAKPPPSPPPRQSPPAAVYDKPVVGRLEYVMIRPENLKVKARIDTGAGTTSLLATNVVRFERDGKPWVRFTIPNAVATGAVSASAPKDSAGDNPPPRSEGDDNGRVYEKPVKRFIETKTFDGADAESRAVVEMILELGPVKELVDVTLSESDNAYQLSIGRNFLRDRAIVDVSRKFSVKTI